MKPKRKTFQNEEDKKKFIDGFTQKKKTELCKNWELNGSCKYGDNVFFEFYNRFINSFINSVLLPMDFMN